MLRQAVDDVIRPHEGAVVLGDRRSSLSSFGGIR
jgi:hypothetical protein